MDLPVLDKGRQYAAVLGLARNLAVPLRVLRELMRIPGMVRDIAGRPQIPDDLAELLLEMAEQLSEPSVVFVLDDGDRVSPRMRQRLAPDQLSPKLREACIQNVHSALGGSNTPPLSLLEWLAGSTGPTAWTKLATHSEWQVRKALAAAWKDAPEDIRRALLADPEPEVRAAACGRYLPPPPTDLHSQLIKDPATRAAVAEYIALTPEIAGELATDADLNVRIGVARNPGLPASVRDELAASHDRLVWMNLTRNETTPEPLRAQLYADLNRIDHSALRWRGAPWLRALPLEQALTYLDSPCDFLRCELAKRDDLPAEAIARLDGDPDLEVRQIIALRPGAPGDVLERVVRDSQPYYRYWGRLIRHWNFPPEAFVRFASAPEAKLRVAACYGEQLPADLVAQLVRDADAEVRCAVAGHPKLSADDAVRLLGDGDRDVVGAAARSPALPHVAVDHIVGNLAMLEGYVRRGEPSPREPSRPGPKPASAVPKARETPKTKMPIPKRHLESAYTGLARNPNASLPVLLKLAQHVPGTLREGLEHRSGNIPDELVEALIESNPLDIVHFQNDKRVSPAMRKRLTADDSPQRRGADVKRSSSSSRSAPFLCHWRSSKSLSTRRGLPRGPSWPPIRTTRFAERWLGLGRMHPRKSAARYSPTPSRR